MTAPSLSVIVIVYDIPRQAMNTLRTLAADYQRVRDDAYEVIVVENRSARTLDRDAVEALPGCFRYFLRDEPGVSPAAAINFAFAQARGQFIGLLIDGARMVTPGVVGFAQMAFRFTSAALVCVPGYHLGPEQHQGDPQCGYTEAEEIALLDRTDWHANGYGLFEIACWSGANPGGFFLPMLESNCLFMSAALFREIGQADERFALPGGGALNLYIYYKAALHPRSRSFVLAGEGSFHQLHAGVTTSASEHRNEMLASFRCQLLEMVGDAYHAPRVEPIVLGRLRAPAMPFLVRSVKAAMVRDRRFSGDIGRMFADSAGKDPFATDDAARNASTAPREQS